MNEREWQQWQASAEAAHIISANLAAILDCWGSDSVWHLDRDIYKFTECGPWLQVRLHDGREVTSEKLCFIHNGEVRALRVGSIVEGSDAEVTGDWLDLLQFDSDEEAVKAFNAQLDKVNELAAHFWKEAHGGRDDA